MKFNLFIFACLLGSSVAAQPLSYKTWNPALESFNTIQGKGWPGQTRSYYDRLPAKAEKMVRDDVWDLSRNSAGMSVRFRTDAEEIVVRYTVTGELNMPHMESIGVSGVDLYSKTIDGEWRWCGGRFKFGDTIVCRFTKLDGKDGHVPNREYTLYLPLYNTVKWMEIRVPEQNAFSALPAASERPIVIYGTSIAQGGCASRAGLAWTNILGRKIGHPVINLAFSGNGRLEPELIGLLAELDARVYVLDCLPNLVGSYVNSGELKKRIIASVVQLQQRKPGVPILFAEHDGYTDGGVNPTRHKEYSEANAVLRSTVDSLVASGTTGLFYLTEKEIGQDIESTVDGTHPNDIGMMHYADAYAKKVSGILNEPIVGVRTTIPVTQRRDFATYDWEQRHQQVLDYNRSHKPQWVMIGNSITHFWGGEPLSSIHRGQDSWDKYFGGFHAVNMGFGWDRIENVLWRIHHGELDGFQAKYIYLNIGTNNLQIDTDKDILEGLGAVLELIRKKQSEAKVILSGIYPRRGMEARILQLNVSIAKLAQEHNCRFADPGRVFLGSDQKINEAWFTDGLHPNAEGYDKLGKEILRSIQ